jgi:Ca2+/H+ antiporter, TMEM165/GDT1 family
MPTDQADQTVWQVFGSTFVTIFLAEVGDKTQVTTLLMSAQSHKPWVVFAGASSALVATSLLGVLLGRWLAKRLSPRTLEVGAGLTLLVIAVLLVWDLAKEAV